MYAKSVPQRKKEMLAVISVKKFRSLPANGKNRQ